MLRKDFKAGNLYFTSTECFMKLILYNKIIQDEMLGIPIGVLSIILCYDIDINKIIIKKQVIHKCQMNVNIHHVI